MSSDYMKVFTEGAKSQHKYGRSKIIEGLIGLIICIILCILLYKSDGFEPLVFVFIIGVVFNILYIRHGLIIMKSAKEDVLTDSELIRSGEYLDMFVKGMIDRDTLFRELSPSSVEYFNNNPVQITKDHFLDMINKTLETDYDATSKLQEWVHVIWFNDYFTIDDEIAGSIERVEQYKLMCLGISRDVVLKLKEGLVSKN